MEFLEGIGGVIKTALSATPAGQRIAKVEQGNLRGDLETLQQMMSNPTANPQDIQMLSQKIIANNPRLASIGKQMQFIAGQQRNARGFTIGAGQERYDAQGNLIASGPDKPLPGSGKLVQVEDPNNPGQMIWQQLNDAVGMNSTDPTKQASIEAQTNQRNAAASLSARKVEYYDTLEEFKNADTAEKKALLQPKIDKLSAEIGEINAQATKALNPEPTAAQAAATMDMLTNQLYANRKNGEVADPNLEAELQADLKNVRAFSRKKYAKSPLTDEAAKGLLGVQNRDQAFADGNAVTSNGITPGNTPKTYQDIGVTDQKAQTNLFELEQQVSNSMPEGFDVKADYSANKDFYDKVLIPWSKNGVPDSSSPGKTIKLSKAQLGALAKLNAKEKQSVMAAIQQNPANIDRILERLK